MKTTRTKVATLTATLITFGSLVGGAKAATVLTGTSSWSETGLMAADTNWPSGVGYASLAGLLNSSGGTLKAIEFIGSADSASAQTFNIAIMQNDGAGGSPGTIVFPETGVVVFSKTKIHPTAPRYSYQADLPSDIVLPAGDLWLAILDTTDDVVYTQYLLDVSSGAGATHARSGSMTSGYPSGLGVQRRMSLNGFDVRFDSSVPEPSSVLLLGLGSIGFVLRRNRS